MSTGVVTVMLVKSVSHLTMIDAVCGPESWSDMLEGTVTLLVQSPQSTKCLFICCLQEHPTAAKLWVYSKVVITERFQITLLYVSCQFKRAGC